MAKKDEEKKVVEKPEVIEVPEVSKITFRVHDGKNFTGFMHPKTRRLVTADKDGLFKVDPTDEAALAILTGAQDTFKV